MTNPPQQFDQHSHSMAETAVIIHECLLDMPSANLALQWYIATNGICEGRSRIVDFAVKLEGVWNGLTEQQSIDQALVFDCFDLDYCPRIIAWAEKQMRQKKNGFWWEVDSELIKMFTLAPADE